MVDREVVKDLISALRAGVSPQTMREGERDYLVYSLSDVTLRFVKGDRMTFDSLVFKAFEQYFSIGTDLKLVLHGQDGTVRDVTDPTLVQSMATYLQWRMSIFNLLGV